MSEVNYVKNQHKMFLVTKFLNSHICLISCNFVQNRDMKSLATWETEPDTPLVKNVLLRGYHKDVY